jgi:precorrin-3B C17-methyltransferase
MAAAVCEAIEAGPDAWHRRSHHGARRHRDARRRRAHRRAARARFLRDLAFRQPEALGAGRARLRAGGEAGFVIALYNPDQQGAALAARRGPSSDLRGRCGPRRPVVFGRAVSRPDERIETVPSARPMRSAPTWRRCVLIGTAETRVIARPGLPPLVYTPRFSLEGAAMIDPAAPPRRWRRWARPALRAGAPSERPAGPAARRRDLAVGGVAAGVLADDDHVDAVLAQKPTSSSTRKGPRPST